MRWTLKASNILDEPADALIVSANQTLLLSTHGVGSALEERYGPKMQEDLKNIVAGRSHRYVSQGEVVPYVDSSLPYKVVLHAVAVDTWQNSTAKVVCGTVIRALKEAVKVDAKKVALSALATGAGNLSLPEFANGIKMMMASNFPPIEEVCICLLEEDRVTELAKLLPDANLAAQPTE